MATRHTIGQRGPGVQVPLSYQQHQLWFLNQLSPEDPAYNCGYVMRITGPLDPVLFERAVNAVLERHESLRTRFVSIGGEPVQEIAQDWSGTLTKIDLSFLPAHERQLEADRLVKVYAGLFFDFSRDLPTRFLLVRFSRDEHLFAYYPHHIVWELRSTALFFAELSAFYSAFLAGREPDLAPLPIQYADYAVWQREYIADERLERLQHYWKEQLAGAPSRTNFPLDRPHPELQTHHGARLPLILSPAMVERVAAFSAENNSSPYRVLCALFNLLVHCYTGQHHICLGTPVAPPLPPEVEPMIGLFAYTVVIHTKIEETATFRELTKDVGSSVTGAIRRALPFDLIVKAVQPPRDTSRMLLFQVNFRVIKMALEPLSLPGMEITPPEWVDTDTAKFDLSMELVANGAPGGFIEYRTDLFDKATIVRLADDYFGLLDRMLLEPDRPIGEVSAIAALRSRFRRLKPPPPRTNQRGRGIKVDLS